MNLRSLIARNLKRNPRTLAFSTIGIVLGVASFVFFVALGEGVRTNVLQKIFVVDQVEVVPRTIRMGAFETRGLGSRLDQGTIRDIEAIPGVSAIYPKKHVGFPAFASGGESLLGQRLYTELIGDGIPPDLVADRFGGADRGHNRFVDWDASVACAGDDECAPGATCVDDVCRPTSCAPATEVWLADSRADAERARRHVVALTELRPRAVAIREVDGVPHPFRLDVPASGILEAGEALEDFDGPGSPADGSAGCGGAPLYCQPQERVCRMPVPVLMSYTLLELYNGNVQSSVGGAAGAIRNLPRMTEDAFIGFEFDAELGRGFLGESGALEDAPPLDVRLRIVGFSQRAISLGVTMPLPYVERWNERYGDPNEVGAFDSLLVVTDDSRSLQSVAHALTEDLSLQLDERYEQAQRASLMITIVTSVMALLSVLIVGLAALNIMHTFLMVIAERRREIGILRAVGGTRASIYFLLFGEAAFIAVVGGSLAVGLSLAAIKVTDQVFASRTPAFPFKPESLFHVPGWLLGAAFGIAIAFCLLGAWFPARRAARMDPTEAIRGR